MQDFAYTVVSAKDFDAVVTAVERLTPEKGFSVQHVHDVQATLTSKGFEAGPLKIIEV